MSTTSDDGRTVRSPRKGAQDGPVSELSVFLKVKPGREQAIREVFNMPSAERAVLVKAIADVGTLHSGQVRPVRQRDAPAGCDDVRW